jgi:pyruvate, orthophosphate dikinase
MIKEEARRRARHRARHGRPEGTGRALQGADPRALGRDFPTDPWEQLWGAVVAVFESWNNDRARVYRELNDIPEILGHGGQRAGHGLRQPGRHSATGVAFTRDAGTGEDLFNGEFLVNAQGEDVVAGIRTPQQVTLVGSRRWAELAWSAKPSRAPSTRRWKN